MLIVATDVLLQLHVPPEVLLPNVVVVPAHKLVVPVIDVGAAVTVTTVMAVQVVPNE